MPFFRYKLSLKQIFIAIVIIGLAIISILPFRELKIFSPKFFKKNVPDFQFTDIHISHHKGNNFVLEMDAKSAYIYKADNFATFKKVNGDLFKNNIHILTFEAPEARLNLSEELLNLINVDVTLNTLSPPVSIEADVFRWDSDTEEIYGTGNIKVRNAFGILEGAAISGNMSTKKMTILGPAKTKYTLPHETH